MPGDYLLYPAFVRAQFDAATPRSNRSTLTIAHLTACVYLNYLLISETIITYVRRGSLFAVDPHTISENPECGSLYILWALIVDKSLDISLVYVIVKARKVVLCMSSNDQIWDSDANQVHAPPSTN